MSTSTEPAGFFFNFPLSDEGGHTTDSAGSTASEMPNSIPIPNQGRQVPIRPFHKEMLGRIVSPSTYAFSNSRTEFKYISGQQALEIADSMESDGSLGMGLNSLLTLLDSKHSDLIPGVYEGGLKVWECAFDLVRFLLESGIELKGMKILELGCGVGLPGIHSLLSGAESVHFQDYNPEVIDYLTIPNVILNVGLENWNETEDKCKFYSGDWTTLDYVIKNQYDIILTSETIYSQDSQLKLLTALKKLSSCSGGVVYVAAKTVYFGVGGSVDGFCQLIAEDGTFTVSECLRIQASVPRVILKLIHLKTAIIL